MAKRGENDIPDFKTGWVPHQAVYWMAVGPENKGPENMLRIGSIRIYLNESTSTMGWEYFNMQNQALFKIWEKDVEYDNRRRKLYYIFWKTRDGKIKFFRMIIPSVKAEISKDKVDGKTAATVSFDLITGKKEFFIMEIK